jgi:glycosyltransferase involved in cell wall biosynthesis
MRLLHVTQRYPPAIGGAEKYVADLSEELAKRGHGVDVFTTRALDFHTWRNELPPSDCLDGVRVHRFRSMQRRDWVWRILHYGLRNYWRTRARRYEPFIFFGGGPLSPGMFWSLLAQGRRYDLIHLSCLVYSHVAYGYWAARWLDIPVVITPHLHAEQESTYNIGYQRDALLGSDHVLAVTSAERELLLDLGLDPWRVSVSGNGLRPEVYERALALETTTARRQLGLDPDGFVILFLGRKSDYKGLDRVVDAFAGLRSQKPDTQLLAIGPETDYSRDLWARYQGLEGLHVRGAVAEEDKLAALRACNCLALPSIGEAFGIVYLEAWIMGKPVIGARTRAVASVIRHGDDGLLVTPGDAADLAASLWQLAADPDLAQNMGARGREKVLRRYTVSCITDRVEGACLRVLRERHRARAHKT